MRLGPIQEAIASFHELENAFPEIMSGESSYRFALDFYDSYNFYYSYERGSSHVILLDKPDPADANRKAIKKFLRDAQDKYPEQGEGFKRVLDFLEEEEKEDGGSVRMGGRLLAPNQ
jgi:hypothetical protein